MESCAVRLGVSRLGVVRTVKLGPVKFCIVC